MDRPWALYGDENSGWLSLRLQVTTPDTSDREPLAHWSKTAATER